MEPGRAAACLGLAAAMIPAVCEPWGPAAGVEVERLAYAGWPDAIRLSNARCEVVIVPSIGRIMRFAPMGGPNMLWENPELRGRPAPGPGARSEWVNFGGDKLWSAPQERWAWPPDPYLDGSPWQAVVEKDGSVVLTSRSSPRTGLRFRRRIALHRNQAAAELVNTLINDGPEPVEWAVWEIAQVDDPEWVTMPKGAGRGFEGGYRPFTDNAPPVGAVTLTEAVVLPRRDRGRSYKIGANPRRPRLACGKGGWTFTITGDARTSGTYPDGGCNVEVYSNPDPLRYMELELLGPITRIGAGREITLKTRWELVRDTAGR